ncbi:MAG TPA: hypothetical protein VF288_04015 [Mycobacteriales bacterium]
MTATATSRRWGARADAASRPGLLATDVRAVVLSWFAARVVVVATGHLVAFLHHHVPALPSLGLYAWDGTYYRIIAEHGYHAPVLSHDALRFWPLTPMLARAVSVIGLSAGQSLLVVNNAAALVAAFLLVRLARREGWGDAVAERLPWLFALAPPAFVLVLGYSEGVAIALSLAAFLAYRSGRWWWAVPAGVLCGLSRPVGVLLLVPAALEAAAGWRRASRSGRLARVLAVLAPVAGTLLYVGYVAQSFGGAFGLPYRVQSASNLHGHAGSPISTLDHAFRGAANGNLNSALDLPWLALFLVLLVAMTRLLPASYTAWSAVTVVALFTGSSLNSDQRYLWSAFPFVVVAVMLLARRGQLWWAVLSLSTAALIGSALLAFTRFVVP